MRLVRYLLVFFLSSCICAAQSIAIGAIGGGRLTDDVLSFLTSEAPTVTGAPPFRLESRFYDVGPTIEIGLAHGLSVEFDALYHRQGVFFTFAQITFFQTYRERDNLWELPLLLLRRHAVNPFLEAGIVPRTMTGGITQISYNDFLTLGSAIYIDVPPKPWPKRGICRRWRCSVQSGPPAPRAAGAIYALVHHASPGSSQRTWRIFVESESSGYSRRD